MKVQVRVGEVCVTVEGDDVHYTRRQVRGLLGAVAGVAAMSATEEPSPLIGFTAHIERLPDELADEPA